MQKYENGVLVDLTPEEEAAYTAGQAVASAALVPAQVGLWQARAVLRKHGLFDAIDAYVGADQATYPELWEAWNMGNALYRSGSFVASLGPVFGLTSTQIDAMFIEANAIAF